MASYNVDDLNGPKMPTDDADLAVRAIQLKNAELRQEVQELRIQWNFVLSFLEIKNVAAGIMNNHYKSSTKAPRTKHQVVLRNDKINCLEEQQII